VRYDYAYGGVEEDWSESRYPYQCPDGTWIDKVTEVCALTRLVTKTTIKYQSSPYGAPCLPIVNSEEYYEEVGNAVYEWGDLCPVEAGICCIVWAHGWEYEYGDSGTWINDSFRDIVCPNGELGIEFTQTRENYQLRRARTWTWSAPMGDCQGHEVCEDTENFGPWIRFPLHTFTLVRNNCPTGPGARGLLRGEQWRIGAVGEGGVSGPRGEGGAGARREC